VKRKDDQQQGALVQGLFSRFLSQGKVKRKDDQQQLLTHKAFQFRLYPSREQAALIHRMFGCCRFVFNQLLEEWNEACKETGKGLSYHKTATRIPTLKQSYPWLKEVDSIALQSSVRHLVDAFDRFFKGKNKQPRYKSRKNPVQAYTTKLTNGNIAVEGNRLKLPKLGWIRFAKSRELEGRIVFASVR
jgi:putative transposase